MASAEDFVFTLIGIKDYVPIWAPRRWYSAYWSKAPMIPTISDKEPTIDVYSVDEALDAFLTFPFELEKSLEGEKDNNMSKHYGSKEYCGAYSKSVGILAAPPHSGKTHSLYMATQRLIEKGGHVVYYSPLELAIDDNFYQKIGIFKQSDVQYFRTAIPKNTLFIFDGFTESSPDWFFELIYGLSNIIFDGTLFKVIVTAKSPEFAERLMQMDGYRKVRLICSPMCFKWGEAECKRFFKESNADPDHIEKCRDACLKSGRAGAIHEIVCQYSPNEYPDEFADFVNGFTEKGRKSVIIRKKL